MVDTVRQRWVALGLLALFLYLFGVASLGLAVQVSAQVLFRFRNFHSGLPIATLVVLGTARRLATPGAFLMPLVFPAAYVTGLARRWSSLGLLVSVFGLFVILLLGVTLVAGTALVPFASMCSGAWA